jgi:hypothetical protein
MDRAFSLWEVYSFCEWPSSVVFPMFVLLTTCVVYVDVPVFSYW